LKPPAESRRKPTINQFTIHGKKKFLVTGSSFLEKRRIQNPGARIQKNRTRITRSKRIFTDLILASKALRYKGKKSRWGYGELIYPVAGAGGSFVKNWES